MRRSRGSKHRKVQSDVTTVAEENQREEMDRLARHEPDRLRQFTVRLTITCFITPPLLLPHPDRYVYVLRFNTFLSLSVFTSHFT